MIAIDFFCGAGGLTRGLLNAGIDVRLGIDIDKACRQTYEHNNGPARFLAADIQRLQPDDVRDVIGDIDPDDLLLAACAPCQPFARLNRTVRRDRSARLLGQFARFVVAFRPMRIFVENVPGLAKVGGYSSYKRFCHLLREHGYEYRSDVLDAKEYGVPQTRRRLVLIAARDVRPVLPSPTHGPGRLAYSTVANAIRHFPPIQAGETHPEVPNHRASALSEINLRRLQHTDPNGGSRTQWPDDLWLTCHRDAPGDYTDVYGRLRWDQPAPTLTCRCHSISNGRYGHPEQHRAISLREAASLQSFADDYLFSGTSLRHLAVQIGNAVPVRLAEVVGRHLAALE